MSYCNTRFLAPRRGFAALSILAVGAVLAISAGRARAAVTFDLVSTDIGENINLSTNGGTSSESVYAGISNATVNGTAYGAFCVDTLHNISYGTNNLSANLYNFNDTTGFQTQSGYGTSAQNTQAVAYIVSKYLTGNYNSTYSSEQAAEAQIAIWQIITDGNKTITVGANANHLGASGDTLVVSGGDISTSAVNSIIDNAVQSCTSTTSALWVSNPQGGPGTNYQDFGILDSGGTLSGHGLVGTPEPGLMSLGGMFAMSAAGYGMRLRRWRRRG